MKTKHQEAPFTLGANDRFHAILCSKPVRFDDKTKAEIILTFYFIRRSDGTCSISNVNRTYDSKGSCVSRAVQNKDNIPASKIDEEVRGIKENFSKGVEAGSGRKLEWDYLDLSGVVDRQEQLRAISIWGRVEICIADIPPLSPN